MLLPAPGGAVAPAPEGTEVGAERVERIRGGRDAERVAG
jgi:hypothetical protein